MPQHPCAKHDVIYKYPLEVEAVQDLKIDPSAKILLVEVQHGTPCIWASVNSSAAPVTRRVLMTGTGHTFPDHFGPVPFARQHIGTVQLNGFVWHYFWEI